MNRLDGNAHGDQAERFALRRTYERQLSSVRRLAEWRILGPILAKAATDPKPTWLSAVSHGWKQHRTVFSAKSPSRLCRHQVVAEFAAEILVKPLDADRHQ